MARPTTKTELLIAAADGWSKLQKAIAAMPDKNAAFIYVVSAASPQILR
jgi:hypothetical protein